MTGLFSFPNPVNEKAARVVAGGVFVMSAIALVTSWYWLLVPLAYGFVARVLTGPTLSPLGLLASGVIAPRLGPPKPVPGPPKRFAQAMGATMTVAAALLALVLGQQGSADALLAAMVVAAGLEAFVAICLGCHIFSLLMRAGIVPETVCVDCADIWSGSERAKPSASQPEGLLRESVLCGWDRVGLAAVISMAAAGRERPRQVAAKVGMTVRSSVSKALRGRPAEVWPSGA